MVYKQENKRIVIEATPLLHGFPWLVPENVKNKRVLQALKKQPFRQFRLGLGKHLAPLVAKLHRRGCQSEWVKATQDQTPTELWARKDALTEFQVWTAYRIAVSQLNLYFPGREQSAHCRMTQRCEGHKETLEHLLWACPYAEAVWTILVEHWTGSTVTQVEMAKYQYFVASRTPPALTARFKQRIIAQYGELTPDHAKAARCLWWAFCSIAMASLWMTRNRKVHRQELVTVQQGKTEIWKTVLRQLRAVAHRDSRSIENRMFGLRLRQVLDCFEYKNPQQGEAHMPKAEKPRNKPPIVKWLRIFQDAIN